MLINAVYLLTGALGGVIIGALGSGSSLVILPVLSLILPTIFPEAVSLKVAVATCLATLVIGSASGALSYARSKFYDSKLVKLCLPGIILGAVIAPLLANILSPQWLRLYISLFIVTIAVYKLITGFTSCSVTPRPFEPVLIVIVSIVCTVLSGLAGIALGILMIPFLSRYSDHRTVLGSNLILAFPYAVIGSIGYIISGMQPSSDSSEFMVGYVYVTAFLVISITMAIFPPVGLKLVKNIGVRVTQRLFYLYLLVIGITLFLQS